MSFAIRIVFALLIVGAEAAKLTQTDTSTTHSEIKVIRKDDPCKTSDPTGAGCKKYNMPLPPPPEPEPRIGYYTPEGQWIVPKKNESQSLNSTSLIQSSSIPCNTSDPTNAVCKRYNQPPIAPSQSEKRIGFGYYTPKGEWVIPIALNQKNSIPCNTSDPTNAVCKKFQQSSPPPQPSQPELKIEGKYTPEGHWIIPNVTDTASLQQRNSIPCNTSDPTNAVCKKFQAGDLPPPEPAKRIGSYSPEGQWVIPIALNQKDSIPCNTSDPTNAVCKKFQSSLPPPQPEKRIGSYTPEGQWVIPNNTDSQTLHQMK